MKLIEDSNFKGWILFFDTEGFAANNVSENYDAKIFAVSTLLSSKLLYNSVKIIDQSDVDYLELLARRTQLFALKAQMSPVKNWTENFSTKLLRFPSLIWVIQDFVQETDGEDCRDWLLKLLSTHTRETETYEISLKDIFPEVDCHTLFIPCAKKNLLSDLSQTTEMDLISEYKQERDQLRKKIKLNINPKMKNDEPFTGSEIVFLLRLLVDAANSGYINDVPNRWESFLDKLQKSSVEECFKFYQSCMEYFILEQNNNEAVKMNLLEQIHSNSKEKSTNLLFHLLSGLEKSYSTSKIELFDKIDKSFIITSELNKQRIEMKILNLKKKSEIKISEQFLKLQLPMLTTEIFNFGEALYDQIIIEFYNDIAGLVSNENLTNVIYSLKEFISLNVDSTKLKNSQVIEDFFDDVIQTALEEFLDDVQINVNIPLSFDQFELFLSKKTENSIRSFKSKVAQYSSEKNIFDAKMYHLSTILLEKAKMLRVDQENAVRLFLKNELSNFYTDFSQQTQHKNLHFPIDFEELNLFLDSKSSKTISIFLSDMQDYSKYECFQQIVNEFNSGIKSICDLLRDANLKAFKSEVEQPLNFAKKSILLSKSKYPSLYCFRKFVSHYISMIFIK